MPIDSVSSAQAVALQRLEQLAQGAVRPALRLEVAGGLGNRHQAAQRAAAASAATARRQRRRPRAGASAALARLAADVDLQADLQRRQRRRPLRAQPLGELQPVDRVHPVEVLGDDAASCCSAAGRSGATRSAPRRSASASDLLQRFLHVVLAEAALARRNGPRAPRRGRRSCSREQRDAFHGAPGAGASACNALVHTGASLSAIIAIIVATAARAATPVAAPEAPLPDDPWTSPNCWRSRSRTRRPTCTSRPACRR